MGKDMLRLAIYVVIGYLVLWYTGAMYNFFPFLGNDFAVRAIGFTGLLICMVIVACTCWMIHENKKK